MACGVTGVVGAISEWIVATSLMGMALSVNGDTFFDHAAEALRSLRIDMNAGGGVLHCGFVTDCHGGLHLDCPRHSVSERAIDLRHNYLMAGQGVHGTHAIPSRRSSLIQASLEK